MQKIAFRHVSLAALALVLGACGGGDSSPSPPPNPDSPQGIFSGRSSNNFDIGGLVLETNEYYFFYAQGNVIFGVVQGNMSAANGTYTSSNGIDFSLINGRIPATVSGNYVPKQALQGTVSEAAGSITFNATYQSSYDTPASLASAAGTYSGAAATGNGGSSPILLTILSNGTFTGTSPGTSGLCSFSGTLTPRATGKNVFNVSVTFGNANCALGTTTVNGYAVPVAGTNGSTTTLYAVGLLPDRSNGFIAIGQKQ